MALIIVLSGPKTTVQQAKTALERAGYPVGPETHSHGLPDAKTAKAGKRGRQAIGWLTVTTEKDDPTPARDAVAGLGWQLRSHRRPSPAPEPSLGVVLARMQAEIDELKGRA